VHGCKLAVSDADSDGLSDALKLLVSLSVTVSCESVSVRLPADDETDGVGKEADAVGSDQLKLKLCWESESVSLGVERRVAVWDTDIVDDWDALADFVAVKDQEGNVVERETVSDELAESVVVPSVAEIVGWVRLMEKEVEAVSEALKCV
jgi:hypothetical protein